jgi:hypothetical protein
MFFTKTNRNSGINLGRMLCHANRTTASRSISTAFYARPGSRQAIITCHGGDAESSALAQPYPRPELPPVTITVCRGSEAGPLSSLFARIDPIPMPAAIDIR